MTMAPEGAMRQCTPKRHDVRRRRAMSATGNAHRAGGSRTNQYAARMSTTNTSVELAGIEPVFLSP